MNAISNSMPWYRHLSHCLMMGLSLGSLSTARTCLVSLHVFIMFYVHSRIECRQ
ncbi:hypothetical protein BDV18DRAFT_145261 [Aspergillus unguis]